MEPGRPDTCNITVSRVRLSSNKEFPCDFVNIHVLRFLDLSVVYPRMFIVPTLDIDLVWHTHQLTDKKYASDCMNFTNRYVEQ